MLPTNYYIDVIPVIFVCAISLIVGGLVKLITMACEYESKRFMEEFENELKKETDNDSIF